MNAPEIILGYLEQRMPGYPFDPNLTQQPTRPSNSRTAPSPSQSGIFHVSQLYRCGPIRETSHGTTWDATNGKQIALQKQQTRFSPRDGADVVDLVHAATVAKGSASRQP